MKSLFPGHYFAASTFEEALRDAVIVFDTNVLLNLYDLGPATRTSSFAKLLKIKERCWLPYHVALEFHRNRIGRVEKSLKNHRDAIKRIATGVNEITQHIERQDMLKNDPTIARLIKEFKSAGEALATQAEDATTQLPQKSSEDPVSEFLAELFDNRVGPFPDQPTVDAINKEGVRRFEHKHPPGVTDEIEKSGQKFMDRDVVYAGMYGDLYIWKQILNHVRDVPDKRHLIFVTDERKQDWWAKEGDNLLGPAPELCQELALAAPGWNLWMYRSPNFFDQLSTALGERLTKEELAEIRDASRSQEHSGRPFAYGRKHSRVQTKKPLSFRMWQVAQIENWIRESYVSDNDIEIDIKPGGLGHKFISTELNTSWVEMHYVFFLGERTSILMSDLNEMRDEASAAADQEGLPCSIVFDTTGIDAALRGRICVHVEKACSFLVHDALHPFAGVYVTEITSTQGLQFVKLG